MAPKLVFGDLTRARAGSGVAKIELPESWAGVAEPLPALMARLSARRTRTAPRRRA
jgi:hypothetical protein